LRKRRDKVEREGEERKGQRKEGEVRRGGKRQCRQNSPKIQHIWHYGGRNWGLPHF